MLNFIPSDFFNGNKIQKFSAVGPKRYQIFQISLWVHFSFAECMVTVGYGVNSFARGPHSVSVL